MYRRFLGAICPVPLALATTLFATDGAAQVNLATSIAQIRQLPLASSGDVYHYGTASGETALPQSRMQVFGFPRPGVTIELQVIGARPNVDATFCVSTGYADQQVAGLGRVLVDTNGASTYQTTTDASGRAVWPLALPSTMQVGDELFVQCTTIDTGAPSPKVELSSAAYLQLGSAAKPIGMVSHLAGTVTITNGGPSASALLSGIYAQEWKPGTGGNVNGTAAVHTATDTITVNGTVIEQLFIQPGANDNSVTWQASNFLLLSSVADEFLLSFASQGIEYGPYVVPGTITANVGGVSVQLGTVPTTDNNPLGGASLSLAMAEAFIGPEYFAALDALGLPDGAFGQAAAITPRQINTRFADAMARMAEILTAHNGDTTMFSARMPTYTQFVADEGVSLSEFTAGATSTVSGIHAAVDSGQMQVDDGVLMTILGKLAGALGITNFVNGFQDAVTEYCGSQLKEMGKQLDAGEFKAAAKTLGKILKSMASKGFAKKLADKIGKEAATKILRKLGAKCVPVLGWIIFAGEVIWAFAEQWFD